MKIWTETDFLNQNTWYHGTKKDWATNIVLNGVDAKKNRGKPSDFGRGLYLCPDKEWAIKYAESLLVATDSNAKIDADDGIVLQFSFVPQKYIDKYSYKYFGGMTKAYAEFVLFNWRYPKLSWILRQKDMTFGPMTDGKQLLLMQRLQNHEIGKQEAIAELLSPKEDWQLTIRSQALCDELIICRAFNLKGDEVHVG